MQKQNLNNPKKCKTSPKIVFWGNGRSVGRSVGYSAAVGGGRGAVGGGRRRAAGGREDGCGL